MFPEEFGDEVAFGDLEFLKRRVAGDFDDLHAVSQSGRDRGQNVGRGDEENLGQIKSDVPIVVGEGFVLLGARTSSIAEDGSP